VAVPIDVSDEVEELGAEEMVAIDDSPVVATAIMDEPATAAAGDGAGLSARVQELEEQLQTLRRHHRIELEELLRELNSLTDRVRAQLG
jgi:hypothetical protein